MNDTVLTWTPGAWLKAAFLADQSENEVTMMGVTDKKNEKVIDVLLPKQTVSRASIEFDGNAYGELLEFAHKQGIQPNRLRVWLHTHPNGMGSTPSGTDQETFKEVFEAYSWIVMAIMYQPSGSPGLAGWRMTAKLRVLTDFGPVESDMKVGVLWNELISAKTRMALEKLYESQVEVEAPSTQRVIPFPNRTFPTYAQGSRRYQGVTGNQTGSTVASDSSVTEWPETGSGGLLLCKKCETIAIHAVEVRMDVDKVPHCVRCDSVLELVARKAVDKS